MSPERPDVAYCSYRVPRVGDGVVWPSQARQRALRYLSDDGHPRGWCRNPAVARFQISDGWSGALCDEHLGLYASLDGRHAIETVKERLKTPPRTIQICPIRPSRRRRQWTPRTQH
jgi:hypothetical protein